MTQGKQLSTIIATFVEQCKARVDTMNVVKETYVSPEIEVLEMTFREGLLQVPSGGQFGDELQAGSPLTEDPIIFF